MKLCDVCYTESDAKSFFGLNCNHVFCRGCMEDHLKAKVMDGNVEDIPCLQVGCSEIFSRDQIQSFGSKEIYEKYLQFRLNIDVDMDPKLKWCPRSNCNRFVRKTGIFQKKVTCECGAVVCLKCGQLDHPGKKCGQHD